MVFQDPTGALNARQTIYEAVAEGLRIQKVEGDEEQLVAAALARSGLRPPERFFGLLPVRDLGRPAPARGDRRRDGPRAASCSSPTSRCRASTRRCAARSSQLMLGLVRETGVAILVVTHDLGLAWNIADRVAVMYLGRIVEHGHDRGAALRAAASLHARAALGRAGGGPPRAADPRRRGARPDAHPIRLPLPPALPGRRVGRGGADGDRGALPRRGPRARAGADARRPGRRTSRLATRCTPRVGWRPRRRGRARRPPGCRMCTRARRTPRRGRQTPSTEPRRPSAERRARTGERGARSRSGRARRAEPRWPRSGGDTRRRADAPAPRLSRTRPAGSRGAARRAPARRIRARRTASAAPTARR